MELRQLFINNKKFRFKKKPKPVIEIDKNLYLSEVKQLSPSKVTEASVEYAEIPFGLGKSEKFENKQQIITAFTELGYISDKTLEIPTKYTPVYRPTKGVSPSPISVEHFFHKKIVSPYSPGVVRIKSKDNNELSINSNPYSPQKRPSFLSSQRQFTTPQPSVSSANTSGKPFDSPKMKSGFPSYIKTITSFSTISSPNKLKAGSNRYANIKEIIEIQEAPKIKKTKAYLQTADILEYTGNYLQGQKEGFGKVFYKNGDKFKGVFRKNLKEGQGKYFYSKFGLTFKGEFKNDVPHGPALLEFNSGGVYKISFVNGKLDDNLVLIKYKDGGEYDGEFKNGRRHGYGKMEYSNGGNYSGKWVNGQRQGLGVLTFKASMFFEGTFFGDFTDGPGVLVRKDLFHPDKEKLKSETRSALFMKHEGVINKKTYFEDFSEFSHFKTLPLDGFDLVYITLKSKYLQPRLNKVIPNGKFSAGRLTGGGMVKYGYFGLYYGNFLEGKRSGYGCMKYTDPEHICDWFSETEGEYIGEWKDDKRQGYGVMNWPNGVTYTGWFNNNRRHNVQGKIQFTNGDIYEGGWVDDRMEGSCVLHKKGITVKGTYKAGVLTNLATLVYPDGKVYEGEIFNCLPHGSGRMKWGNGNLFEGEFCEGSIEGVGRMIYANGDVYEGSWENGSRNGFGVFISNGNKDKYEGDWVEDKRSGEGVVKNQRGEIIKSGFWSSDNLMI